MLHISICDCITIFLLKIFGKSFFEYKYNDPNIQKIITVLFIIVMITINYAGTSNYKAFCLLIVYNLYLFMLYKSNFIRIFFVGLSFFITVIISEIITFLLVSRIYSTINILYTNTLGYTISLYLSSFFTFIFLQLLLKIKKLFNLHILPKFSWLVLILPILTVIIFLSIENYFHLINNIYLLIMIYSLCLFNIINALVFMSIFSFINNQRELAISNHQKELTNIQYRLLNQHYSNNFNFLHDFLHKSIQLEESIQNKDYEKLEQEIHFLVNNVHKKFNLIYTNSIILNTLINNSLNIIIENNIDIKVNIEKRALDFIELKDQFELFNYLFKIALDKNITKSNDKYKIISFKSKRLKNQTVLQIIFSHTEDINIYQDIENNILKILKIYDPKIYIEKNYINNVLSTRISIHFVIDQNINF